MKSTKLLDYLEGRDDIDDATKKRIQLDCLKLSAHCQEMVGFVGEQIEEIYRDTAHPHAQFISQVCKAMTIAIAVDMVNGDFEASTEVIKSLAKFMETQRKFVQTTRGTLEEFRKTHDLETLTEAEVREKAETEGGIWKMLADIEGFQL